MEKHGNMFFTLWYGVYQKSTRTLRYTGGGHPPSMLFLPTSAALATGSEAVRMLETPGPPIGIVADMEFETITTDVPLGSSLFIYSDGAFEVFTSEGKIWGVDGLLEFMQSRDLTSPACLDELYQVVKAMTGSDVLADDFSILLASFRE
jgi:sigma-B regulation protein RsbU (phosphoserine phosphatase)